MMTVCWQSMMKIRNSLEKLSHKVFENSLYWIESLPQADTVSGIPCLLDNSMVRESISKIENGKAS